MSRRFNAPHRDRIEEEGRVLIYEGHDVTRTDTAPDPKSVDQPRLTPSGKLTNGLFERAALAAKSGTLVPELVADYGKIHAGIWASNGIFLLTDAWQETQPERKMFKFRLELDACNLSLESSSDAALETTRIIPSAIKLEMSKRDNGKDLMWSCG